MKGRLRARLIRLAMLFLSLLPVIAIAAHCALNALVLPVSAFAAELLALTALSLLPGYIGNYQETEQIVRVDESRGHDPNPDKQFERTVSRSGHRFPLRVLAMLLFLLAVHIGLALLPLAITNGAPPLPRIVYSAITLVVMLIAARDITGDSGLFTGLQGLIAGMVIYLTASIVLRFLQSDGTSVKLLLNIAAFVFLFLAVFLLNNQSLAAGMSAHTAASAPRPISSRNRLLATVFAGLVSILALLEPIRQGVLWLYFKIVWLAGVLAQFIASLFPAGEDTPLAPVAEDSESLLVPVEETAARDDGFLRVIALIVLILAAAAALWFLGKKLIALGKKLIALIARYAADASGEGFVDERETLLTSEEIGSEWRRRIRAKMDSFRSRPTHWEKLDARGKARRLMQLLYRKNARRVDSLSHLTAQEAARVMETGAADPGKVAALYDRARYSEHEIPETEVESLKKEAHV